MKMAFRFAIIFMSVCMATGSANAEDIGNLPVPVAAYSPSPIQAISAIPREDRIQLLWIAPPEVVPVVYNIEHSLDGEHFESLGELQSRCRVNQASTYIFNHVKPKSGQNFYRIRQTDISGKVSMSKILNVSYEPKTRMSGLPVCRPS